MDAQHVTSRDDVLGKAALHREEVYIKAWGKSIWLRELTLTERLEMEVSPTVESDGQEVEDKQANIDLFLRMLLLSAETPDRQPIFRADDIDALRESSGAGIYEVGMAVLRVNRMQPDILKDLKKS